MKAPIREEVIENNLKIKEISHYGNYDEAEDIFSENLLRKALMTGENCSILDCCCRASMGHDSCCGPKSQEKSCKCSRNCLCSETNNMIHTHGDCEHLKVFHQDHYDYLVEGALHHQTDRGCFLHGYLLAKQLEDCVFS